MRKHNLQAIATIKVIEKNLEQLAELERDARTRGDRDESLAILRGIEQLEAQLDHLRNCLGFLPMEKAPRGQIEKAVRKATLRFARLARRHEEQRKQ